MVPRRRFLGACGLAAAAAALPGAAMAEAATLTATDVHVSEYPTVQATRWFGERLADETDGRLGLRLYHSGQLGRESDQVDMARFGAIDITRVYSGGLHNAFPLTAALGLPYLIRSKAHLRRVIDGPVGAAVLAGFEARGLIGLALYDGGSRSVYNTRRPIVVPADLNGLKLRVPPSDLFIALMRELGANPTPLPFGEVFSSLQTHLIDGAENNIKSFHSSRQFEAARYWSETGHSWAPDVLVMSKRRFDTLRTDDRERVRRLAAESVTVMREQWDRAEDAAREAVRAAGVAFNAVDHTAFEAAARPLRARYAAHPGIGPLMARISDEADANEADA
ncbi:MAG: TRAP transporter substrate-binding protein [Silanimonas sp.]